MLHRHLENRYLSLAAIDDIIERGGLEDWLNLADAIRLNPDQRAQVHQLTLRTVQLSERPDRPSFWLAYC